MTKEKGNNDINETQIADKFSNWRTIIGFFIFIGMGIGNYMINSYRVDEHEIQLEKLDERVSKTEKVNYELLVKQLEEIQRVNGELTNKIEKTNERVDKVLEILLRK